MTSYIPPRTEQEPPTGSSPLSAPDASSDASPNATTHAPAGDSAGEGRGGRRFGNRRFVTKAAIAVVALAVPAAIFGFSSGGKKASALASVQSLWSATTPANAESADSSSVNI